MKRRKKSIENIVDSKYEVEPIKKKQTVEYTYRFNERKTYYIDDVLRKYAIRTIIPGINTDADNSKRYYDIISNYLKPFNYKYNKKHPEEIQNYTKRAKVFNRYMRLYYK